MIVLQTHELSKSYGMQRVFQNVNIGLGANEKLGLIGKNGSGKTTLLRCLQSLEIPDDGQIIVSKNKTIAYLEQFTNLPEDISLWNALMIAFGDLYELRKLLNELEEKMINNRDGEILKQYDRLQEKYKNENGYALETNARRILRGLGFETSEFELPLHVFSGGQKTRIRLACALAKNADILLLDEPTNHLDIQSIEWIENFVKNFHGAILTVSHDRQFLNNTTTRILAIENGQVFSYKGNYDDYERQYQQKMLSLARKYEKQQVHIKETEDYIRRYKAGIKSKQARGREKILNRLEKIDNPNTNKKIVQLKIDYQDSANEVLKISGLAKGFSAKELWSDFNHTIFKGDKVALIGPNGCGKSSLIKIISGSLTPDSGEYLVGSRVSVGYYSQELDGLNANNTILEEIYSSGHLKIEECRSLLGRILFSQDEVDKKIGSLSGGEKSRVAILKLIMSGANFLLLDEPTNHLDIESCQVIENMLRLYGGTILMVSHDRLFIDKICSGILAINEGIITYYPGNYSYYSEKIKTVMDCKTIVESDALLPNKRKVLTQDKVKEKELKKLEKSLSKLEDEITELEKEEECLSVQIEENWSIEKQIEQAKLIQEFEIVKVKLKKNYEMWEEKSQLIQEMQNLIEKV